MSKWKQSWKDEKEKDVVLEKVMELLRQTWDEYKSDVIMGGK